MKSYIMPLLKSDYLISTPFLSNRMNNKIFFKKNLKKIYAFFPKYQAFNRENLNFFIVFLKIAQFGSKTKTVYA